MNDEALRYLFFIRGICIIHKKNSTMSVHILNHKVIEANHFIILFPFVISTKHFPLSFSIALFFLQNRSRNHLRASRKSLLTGKCTASFEKSLSTEQGSGSLKCTCWKSIRWTFYMYMKKYYC